MSPLQDRKFLQGAVAILFLLGNLPPSALPSASVGESVRGRNGGEK